MTTSADAKCSRKDPNAYDIYIDIISSSPNSKGVAPH